jgi:hypothetical protein
MLLQLIRVITMFCPKCGKENPDDHKCCMDCGNSLTGLQPAAPQYRYSPEPWGIGMGILIIAMIYLLPVMPVLKKYVSLAQYLILCNSSAYSCDGTVISWIFFLLWLTALFFIFVSVFNKKRV